MTKKSTRKTPQQTTHSLEKNSRHKKLDTLSSSQTTHSQEKPTNQTGLRASLKAPEKLTTKISNLSTRFTVNQTATLEILERKDPSPPNQNQFKEPALCGSGNYLSPTGPRAVNPKTRAPQHIFGGLAECLSECTLEIPICAGKQLSEPASIYLSGKHLSETPIGTINTHPSRQTPIRAVT